LRAVRLYVLTIPKRFLEIGDPQEGIDGAAGSLEKLLELAAQDEAAGLGDAPWPPHFRKTESEPRRVAPSRARSVANSPRKKMPLIVVANSPSKEAALAGLERWKRKHFKVAKLLAGDDVLVDSMRGQIVNLDADPNKPAPRARAATASSGNSRS
jgi:bifunctional non-homologous end joining protein LigD